MLCVMEGFNLAIKKRDCEPFSTHSMNLHVSVCACMCARVCGGGVVVVVGARR